MAKLCVEVDTDDWIIDFDKEVESFKERLEGYIEDVDRARSEKGEEGFTVIRKDHDETCDYAFALRHLYKAAMELGANHPQTYLHYIREAHARFGRPWFCKAEGCTNQGRYTSGYCGICDIQHNGGKGERIDGA